MRAIGQGNGTSKGMEAERAQCELGVVGESITIGGGSSAGRC